MTARRVLVVYFSRTGHTRALAGSLQTALGAEREEIQDHVERAGILGYLRSGAEALLGSSTHIDLPATDPSGFDLVLVGGPVWAASVCPPVRTWLWLQRDRLPATGLFVTYGGAGSERALGQMRELLGKKPVATLAVREADIQGRKHDAAVRAFVEALLEPPARTRRRRRGGRARAA